MAPTTSLHFPLSQASETHAQRRAVRHRPALMLFIFLSCCSGGWS